ncbi:hypothetical protein [uncultured Campylobacter sp.]|mgnify:CR=1 FL=1|uniref:hypothetical protein n=1 Tax=uncultured Campylobacter sp. TaxID=218934 RepID=UPI0026264903|nr:hypothetical protein [uncultured Campylobacter sp.]
MFYDCFQFIKNFYMTTMAISASTATYITSFTLNLAIVSFFFLAIQKFSIKRVKATKIIITTFLSSLIFCYMFEHFFVKNIEIGSLPFAVFYGFVFCSSIVSSLDNTPADVDPAYGADIYTGITLEKMCSGTYGKFFSSPEDQVLDEQQYQI